MPTPRRSPMSTQSHNRDPWSCQQAQLITCLSLGHHGPHDSCTLNIADRVTRKTLVEELKDVTNLSGDHSGNVSPVSGLDKRLTRRHDQIRLTPNHVRDSRVCSRSPLQKQTNACESPLFTSGVYAHEHWAATASCQLPHPLVLLRTC